MEYASIHRLQEEDIGFAYKMTLIEQWNDRKSDIKRMLDYEPEGCFVANVDGKPAGHVFSISYGKLGWIGLLIVEAEHRRRGVGTLLMKKAMDYLSSRGVETIKLEAVPEIANLYRRLGFVDEFDSLRFAGTCGKSFHHRGHPVTPVAEEVIADLAAFDARYFGAERTRVLYRLSQETSKFSLVSRTKSKITGYIMCRKARSGYKLGPWVCEPRLPQVAKDLLMACMEKLNPKDKLYIGVPGVNSAAIGIVEDMGFRRYSKSIRMQFGKGLDSECIEGIFAIGGPMKG